jgi:sec-independent protein translocase protein TatA
MGNIGTTEIILIFAVLFLFFGAKKIPELAQGLGKGIREFRKASREIQDDIDTDAKKLENKTPDQKG